MYNSIIKVFVYIQIWMNVIYIIYVYMYIDTQFYVICGYDKLMIILSG
jgi:hypothetical protein